MLPRLPRFRTTLILGYCCSPTVAAVEEKRPTKPLLANDTDASSVSLLDAPSSKPLVTCLLLLSTGVLVERCSISNLD